MKLTRSVVVAVSTLLAAILSGVASAQPPAPARSEAADKRGVTLVWESRGQPEFAGFVTDVDGQGTVLVAAGAVGPNESDSQWFVRGVIVGPAQPSGKTATAPSCSARHGTWRSRVTAHSLRRGH
jgi:hypothetical protein